MPALAPTAISSSDRLRLQPDAILDLLLDRSVPQLAVRWRCGVYPGPARALRASRTPVEGPTHQGRAGNRASPGGPPQRRAFQRRQFHRSATAARRGPGACWPAGVRGSAPRSGARPFYLSHPNPHDIRSPPPSSRWSTMTHSGLALQGLSHGPSTSYPAGTHMPPGEQGSGVCAKSGVLKQARRAPTAGFERAKNRSRQSTKTSKRFGPAASFLLASARDLRFSPRAIQQGNVGLLGTQNGIFRSARA